MGRALKYLVPLVAVMASGLAACGSSGDSAKAKDTTTTTTAGTSTTTAAPAAATPYLRGNFTGTYPSGDGLHVVAQAPLPNPLPQTGGGIPFVVKNDTGNPVSDVKASGQVRDPSGKLVATGSDQGFHPAYVAKGGLSFAYIYLDPNATAPPGSTLTIKVTSEKASTKETYAADFTVTEANLVGDQVVGTVTNPRDHEVTGPVKVDVFCFAANGTPTGTMGTYADNADKVPASGTVSFTVSPLHNASTPNIDCAQWTVGASGFDESAL